MSVRSTMICVDSDFCKFVSQYIIAHSYLPYNFSLSVTELGIPDI